MSSLVEEDRNEQREIGVRVPIGVPRPSVDYGGRAWSNTGGQASAPAYNDWGAAARRAAEAEYARQSAMEQAQYQADRAVRNFRQQQLQNHPYSIQPQNPHAWP